MRGPMPVSNSGSSFISNRRARVMMECRYTAAALERCGGGALVEFCDWVDNLLASGDRGQGVAGPTDLLPCVLRASGRHRALMGRQ